MPAQRLGQQEGRGTMSNATLVALPTTAEEAVENGIEMLDILRPGWLSQVNPSGLEMAYGWACIVGQLWGHYGEHYRMVAGLIDPEKAQEYLDDDGALADGLLQRYGLYIPYAHVDWTYSDLTRIWWERINQLRENEE